MIFKIGNYDFTKCIVMGSYTINETDVFSSWVDANGTTHRNITRTKATGTLNLYMRNNQYYVDLVNALKNEKTLGGYYPVTMQTNNTNEVVTRYCYLECNPARNTVGSRDTLAEFTLKVEER